MTETVIERVKVKGDGMTVPLLVFRRFGKTVTGLVETIYATNPGLADLGPYLPLGTQFDMPVTSESGGTTGQAETLAPISLW